jgi:hypothetical protein
MFALPWIGGLQRVLYFTAALKSAFLNSVSIPLLQLA